ncbi:histidine phosphatase family protein [Mycobacterium hubeiense]|uniref:histidine phosphatase family protein n=1 Tax=Mycobacterium hubeiense TaxID=1867256 RepID=UPI000C7EBDBE|nr:histidine phosphatase family protein [Mycobacterium sp. QGD 101]
MRSHSPRKTARVIATALTASALFVASGLPAAAMTVTFIRHGESHANANNRIDTSVPGPDLTPTGEAQADTIADVLQSAEFVNQYGAIDAVYASTMVRTQQTAAPLANDLGLTTVVIGQPKNDNAGQRIGVHELSAGIFEGLPEKDGIGRIGYIVAPLAWTLGLQFVRTPGGESGLEFNERMTNAMKQIEEDTPAGADGEQNAAVFSHGATIMFWTMMNVENPDLLLIVQHPLENTDVVVVEGSEEEGWTLVSWAGQPVDQDPSLPVKLFVNTRDLIVAPQQALYNMRVPVLTPDFPAIAETAAQGVRDVGAASVEFVTGTITDIADSVRGVIPTSLDQQESPATATTLGEPADEPTSAEPLANAEVDTDKSNGATDLTDGNKARPGVSKAVTRASERVRDAVEDARDDVTASLGKVREAVKNAADAGRDRDADNNKTDSGDTGDTGDKDAA